MTSVCSRRGPHCISTTALALPSGSALLTASVLSLRGPDTTRQPIVSSSGDFTLVWNGQIYALRALEGARSQSYEETQQSLKEGHNDGLVLARWIEASVIEQLEQSSSSSTSQHQARRRILFEQVLPLILDSQVEGEWAFTLVDHQSGDVYFGRDALGRRSLLVADPTTTSGSADLLLASAAAPEALSAGLRFTEVDCAGLWVWSSTTPEERPRMFESRARQRVLLREVQQDQAFAAATAEQYASPSQAEREEALDALHATLLSSVTRRVASIGGQVAQDLSLASSSKIGKSSPVAILFSGGLDSALLAWYTHLALPAEQSIDLLNVAFENPRVLQAAQDGSALSSKRGAAKGSSDQQDVTASPSRFSTPDRLLSHLTLAQLRSLSPGRQWNFVEINVTYGEYQSAREEVLAHMHPCESVMDLSLGSVLWFASRGQGSLVQEGGRQEYKTQARVYISGLGADELCGGYSRHRKAFEGRGTTSNPASTPAGSSIGNWAALVEELQMDLDRLPTRNLGRDDRILSSHGREGRYPFLSSNVVSLIASLPLRIKCELGLEQGVGDKILLRQLAKRAGLESVSMEKKRAMQFGARSAKMEVGQGRIKGHMKLGEQAMPGPPRAAKPPAPKVPDAGQASMAPKEVFTTLCYYLTAPHSGRIFPVDDFQLPKALQIAASKHEQEAVPTTTAHWLVEHIPLLQQHIDRLSSSRQVMRETFPTVWAGSPEEKAQKLASRILNALEEALQRFDESLDPSDAPQSNDEERHRRRVRVSLDPRDRIDVVVAKMAPWLPPSATTSAPPPVVRLDVQATGPASAAASASSAAHASPSSLSPQQQQQQLRAPYLYKTSSRDFYDSARERVGATLGLPPAEGNADPCFEVLMWTTNTLETSGSAPDEEKVRVLTESSIANILVQIQEEEVGDESSGVSRWVTPRLVCPPHSRSQGERQVCFLPGLMRSYLLHRGLVEEADLTVEDLLRDARATGEGTQGRKVRMWLCNALRGVMEVRLEIRGEEAGDSR